MGRERIDQRFVVRRCDVGGDFVRCAVTGQPIALDALRYWSVELQEPYADAAASLQRYSETHAKRDAS